MSSNDEIRTAIDEAIALAPETVGTPEPGRGGASVSVVDILSAGSLARMLDAHRRGERGPVYLLCLPKYAPRGTEGWVYTLDKVNKTTVSLIPVGGGRGLRTDPITLAEATKDDLRAYADLRQDDGGAEVHTGSVVRLAGAGWNQPEAALWVVVALKGMTEITVARLGGQERGQVFPKIPRGYVTEVVPAQHLPLAMSADPRFGS